MDDSHIRYGSQGSRQAENSAEKREKKSFFSAREQKQKQKDGGGFSLLGKKKKHKPARQKKSSQSKLPLKTSPDSQPSQDKRKKGGSCPPSPSPASPSWYEERGYTRGPRSNSCPTSPPGYHTYSSGMVTSTVHHGQLISVARQIQEELSCKTVCDVPTYGPLVVQHKSESSEAHEVENSEKGANTIQQSLSPGGSPKVQRIQLRVDNVNKHPCTTPPQTARVHRCHQSPPPPKPKREFHAHMCSSTHSSPAMSYRHRCPAPGLSPELQRSGSYSYTARQTTVEVHQVRSPENQQRSLPDVISNGQIHQPVNQSSSQPVTTLPQYSYPTPTPDTKQGDRICSVVQGSPERHRNIAVQGTPERQRKVNDSFVQGSPVAQGRQPSDSMQEQVMIISVSPGQQVNENIYEPAWGSPKDLVQKLHATPGSSPEVQRLMSRSCPSAAEIEVDWIDVTHDEIDNIYAEMASSRRHGSFEDIKGGYSSEPDSHYDVVSSASYDGHKRSKSVQKPPSTKSAKEGRKNMSRKGVPRRHTVGGVHVEQDPPQENGHDTDRKREQFMELLAKRYPRYAEKISCTASEDGFPVRGRRPRDHHRRATVVTYNPGSLPREYEDAETMSNVEGPISFSRGGFMRSSLPIVRSPPNIYEQPFGCVFLIYREETRRSELPNEITHLDTVRAMFVRAFQGKLSMDMLDSPKRKIYILEPKSSIYYQLEDLRDIKNRSVLKIHECDSSEPQKVKDPPPETRGKMVMGSRDITPPRVPGYPADSPATAITDQVRKAQTLPANMSYSYPPFVDSDYERPRSQTPDPTRSSRTPAHSVHSGIYGRVMYQSPDRQMSASADRPNLRPIPENQQIQNGYVPNNIYDTLDGRPQQQYYVGPQGHHRSMSPPAPRSQPAPGDPALRRALSPPPPSTISQDYDQFRAPGGPAPGAPPTAYVAHGVRASTVVSPLRATNLQGDGRQSTQVNRHSLAFTPLGPTPQPKQMGNGTTQRSQSYRITPERERAPLTVPQRPRSVTPQPVPPDVETKFRMDKMEAQIANLAAWVQSAVVSTESSRASSVKSGVSTTPSETGGSQPGSVCREDNVEGLNGQGLSDVSTLSHQTVTPGIKEGILNIRRQTTELKTDLRSIRRMHQLNKESMQESIQDTVKQITKALSTVPGGEHRLLRKQRSHSDERVMKYINERKEAFKELADLEASVEEVRYDVLSRHCLVNMSDVEGMALLLSYVAKCFGDLRNNFPGMQDDLKKVMAGEMEVVVKEEKFLKDEPERVEEGLKRCKKLTNTLFTLKRLASVQEHRPLQVPGTHIGGKVPTEDDRRSLLNNIQAMVPDHETRVKKLEEADASRERKKKIIIKQEALKFGKSLELASRNLKPASSKEMIPVTSTGSSVVSTVCTSVTVSTSSVPLDASKQTTTTKARSGQGQTDPKSVITSDCNHTKQNGTQKTRQTQSVSKPCVQRQARVKAETSTAPSTGDSTAVTPSAKEKKTTSDIDAKHTAAILRVQKNAARASFFSSLTTPPTSPQEEKKGISTPTTTTMDYTVRISPVKVTSSGVTQYTVTNSVTSTTSHKVSDSDSKPTSLPVASSKKTLFSGDSKSATPSPTSPNFGVMQAVRASNIPRASAQKLSPGSMVSVQKPTCDSSSSSKSDSASSSSSSKSSPDKVSDKKASLETADGKPKKVPPPPPPRKSSRMPNQMPASTTLVTPIPSNGSAISPVKLESSAVQDSSVVTGHMIGASLEVGTLTSTPKTSAPVKPTTKFEKDLVVGSSKNRNAEGKRTENIQHGSESKGTTGAQISETDKKRDERASSSESTTSSSESTTSSGSLDSQQGVVVLRCKTTGGAVAGGKPAKKPKPPPPQRRSSLTSGPPKPEKPSKMNGRSASVDDRLV